MLKEEKRIYNKQYRKNHKEYFKKYEKKYREKHKERRNEYNRKWRKKNLNYQKEYQKTDEYKKYAKKYRENHREHRRKYNNKWRQEHLNHARDYSRNYKKRPIIKERINLRNYAYKHFKDKMVKEIGKCQLNLENCEIDRHLEIHHKEYNNNQESLMLVCRKCHHDFHNHKGE